MWDGPEEGSGMLQKSRIFTFRKLVSRALALSTWQDADVSVDSIWAACLARVVTLPAASVVFGEQSSVTVNSDLPARILILFCDFFQGLTQKGRLVDERYACCFG